MASRSPSLVSPVLGIDFGTSNSAVAARSGAGGVRLLALEGAATALPTAMFFQDEGRSTHFGRDAIARYLAGEEGRLMRSLKSLLGSALIDEQTAVHGASVSFRDIVARFLRELAARAEARLGMRPTRAVLGRPVHFVDDDPARDAQAEAALGQAARSAGFEAIAFQLEPIAAALDYERRITAEARVLVADIGGGTSDFTVVRLGPERARRADRSADILATAGVHVGGTDYDRALNLAEVMPLLGLRHTGPSGREVPSSVFFELATWHLIHRLAAPAALRAARALRGDYRDPRLHARLLAVLEQRHGHRIAHAVEAAKIAASGSGAAALDLSFVEPGLALTLDAAALAAHLRALLAGVLACAQECVRRAGLAAPDAIYLTGGSSALRPFQQALAAAFPGVPLVEGDLFGGVASGLVVGAHPDF
ncbi:Hsp70 family protein [Xylophilus sp. ASV27]|uniref:Hsp70 family protein n=1 Tax=Xylophilus sp. ASV27 TaxID=2795129 RepID=UPI0018EA6842|nr:Hsp70 family protein [Xylophilus sp. ASV27]